MDKFLFIFGLLVFIYCSLFFVTDIISGYKGISLYLIGMLNAAIAMAVSQVLSKIKDLKK